MAPRARWEVVVAHDAWALFDAGGVLVQSAPMTARRRWEAEHGRPAGFLDEAWQQAVGPGWRDGRSEQQIQQNLAELIGMDIANLPPVLEILAAHEVLNAELASYLETVRPLLRTAVVANVGLLRRAELVGRFGVDALVELIVISAEEGVAKPDPAIYLRTCDRLGLTTHECLFIDDMLTNVDGARRVGMHAELYSDVPKLTTLVARLAGGPSCVDGS